jgi:hypothetical protein
MSKLWSLAGMVFMNRRRNPLWVAGLGMAAMLALSGCAAVQVKLGMKVYLAKTPITSIDVGQPKGPGIGPGQSSPLVVEFTQPDGKVLQTEGAGKGKVLWQDFVVTPTVVTAYHYHGPQPSRTPRGTGHSLALRLQLRFEFLRQLRLQRFEWHGWIERHERQPGLDGSE